MRSAAILCLLLIIASCGSRKEDRGLPEEKFVRVYADLMEAAAAMKGVAQDSAATADSVLRIFQRNGVSRDEFRATVEWYNADVARWGALYPQVIQELEERGKRRGV